MLGTYCVQGTAPEIVGVTNTNKKGTFHRKKENPLMRVCYTQEENKPFMEKGILSAGP